MKTIASQWDQKGQKMLGRTQDAHKINSSLIKISVDGTITIYRQKTGNKSFIPILQIAQILIDKYTTVQKPDMCVFPVYTSQRMNMYLKVIGRLSGVNKK